MALLQKFHENTDSEDLTPDDDDIASTSFTQSDRKEALIVTLRAQQRPDNNEFQQ